LLFLFGFACIPAVHLFEKLFNDASFANMSIFCLNVVIALATTLSIIIIDVLGESENSEKIRNFLNRLFLIFPQHALADGLIEICKNHVSAEIFQRFYINSYKSPVTSDLLRPHFSSLFLLGILFIFINFVIESGLISRILNKQPKILKNELKMISIQNTLKKDEKTLSYAEYALKVDNLYKKYNNQGYAVNNVSFKVKSGETFGLLGMNGAGKSTIFSILSGAARQGSGSIEFSHLGFNLHGLSYCPQNNAMDPLLTVSEVIQFYGKLRNIKDLEVLTEQTVKSFHLEQYKNVLVKNLSGGNRRKLSVACACFGNINIVLMDEPTSDMDPLTRNLVYKTIKELNDNNCAVILTSHSVSEIEMLCHSVGVLAEGKMIATGTPEILRKKFGNRYVVTVFSERPLAKEFEEVRLFYFWELFNGFCWVFKISVKILNKFNEA
jgi:ABC-type multidrug transport system ATPase subunit